MRMKGIFLRPFIRLGSKVKLILFLTLLASVTILLAYLVGDAQQPPVEADNLFTPPTVSSPIPRTEVLTPLPTISTTVQIELTSTSQAIEVTVVPPLIPPGFGATR